MKCDELKSFIVLYDGKFIRAYKESEADKYIALLKDKANYNEYAYKLKSEELADTCRFYEEELRHQKYKRCLAMAEWCELGISYWDDDEQEGGWEYKKLQHCIRWNQRWLAIAEKFKPNKEAK